MSMSEAQSLILQRMLSHDFYLSPLKFAMFAYPWGQGDLKQFSGPRKWQREVMMEVEQYLRDAIKTKEETGRLPDFFRCAIASGRGPGKSALVGMLAHWFISTRIGGSTWVAANGEPQLRTKTFPEISKWVARGINADFFDINATSIQPATWFKNYIESPEGLARSTRYYYASGQLWSEENPDSFAGAHNFDGEMAIFDEASGIPTPIWTVQEGVFTEDIPDRFWFAFSNPRSTEGAFFECFHKNRNLWRTRQIDSRTVEGISHQTYENIIAQHGAESNEARVEVYGEFPTSGEDQFISPFLYEEAAARPRANDPDAPIVIGVDPARSGLDSTVIAVRQGRDLLALKRYSGEDTMQVVGHIISAMNEWEPQLVVVDEGGIGAGVFDRLKEQGYKQVKPFNFGWKSSNPVAWGNARAEVWGMMKDWLKTASVPSDTRLRDALTAPNKKPNSAGVMFLEGKKEMKARGLASPDEGDALAISLWYPVAKKTASRHPLKDRKGGAKDFLYRQAAKNGAWMG